MEGGSRKKVVSCLHLPMFLSPSQLSTPQRPELLITVGSYVQYYCSSLELRRTSQRKEKGPLLATQKGKRERERDQGAFAALTQPSSFLSYRERHGLRVGKQLFLSSLSGVCSYTTNGATR